MLSNYPSGSDNECSPWNQEDCEVVSDCCGATIIEDTDICSECREHCGEMEVGEE